MKLIYSFTVMAAKQRRKELYRRKRVSVL